MADIPLGMQSGEGSVEPGGYQQELKRTLGSFQLVVLMVALPGSALLKLIVASTILPAIIYSATIVLYLVVRKRLGRKEGAFNLGRLELPVAISALVWVVCALFVLTVPRDALVPDLVVVGLVAAGGLFLLSLLIFHPETLELPIALSGQKKGAKATGGRTVAELPPAR
jgi:hypothetical protein